MSDGVGRNNRWCRWAYSEGIGGVGHAVRHRRAGIATYQWTLAQRYIGFRSCITGTQWTRRDDCMINTQHYVKINCNGFIYRLLTF